MNRVSLFLLVSLILLFSCPLSEGQGCSVTLVPYFSVYNSVSRDGKNIYTSVTMQGYASICGPCGCPQMKTATHKAAAENKLNNVDHWSYSASGCPTCYFSVTDYEQIVGVPGVLYPFTWEGQAICSFVGGFWSGLGGPISIEGCMVPSTEATADAGFNLASLREQFEMTLGDSSGDSFDSSPQVPNIHEVTAATGTNGCYWSNSGLSQYPGVQGSYWSVGTVAGVTQHNRWGLDSIGWNQSDLDNIITNGPAHGIHFPCVTTIHQGMQIMCNATTWWQYRTDVIQISVDDDRTEENCRDSVCGAWQPFAHRIAGQPTWWAHLWRDHRDDFSVVTEGRQQ